MEFSIINVPDQLVLGIKQKGHYRQIPELFSKLYHYATSHKAQFSGMPAFLFHEKIEDASEADKAGSATLEVVAPVSAKVEDSEDVKCYTLEGAKMAKAVHKGPYDQSGPVYEALTKWIQEQDKQIIGPIREVYMNDPNEVKPEDILTEIYIPVN